ncbi:uncharacterized protein LOC109805437 [Cajanus cajan]|uniref:Uncharacterized protein n=1 Tax=Cajanus cajan TaxID=3821 RepID=A0A151SZF8_CAJCA|nr:uncharacterized protein LOC109805437 [Cajanus cajan]KYP60121.1 hypothetical protein KK1_015569 [Cajanus cajan]
MMEEQAKEELKMLEAQYPNQHEFLKHELRSLIFQLQSKHQDSEPLPENNHCNLAFRDTQESTSLEQGKSSSHGSELGLAERVVTDGKVDENSELETPKIDVMKHFSSRKNKRKDRVDLVLERAQVCLKKIKHLKIFLFSPS